MRTAGKWNLEEKKWKDVYKVVILQKYKDS